MKSHVFTVERVSVSLPTIHYKAQLLAQHPIFEGHFPQRAVVPGVCTMNMVKHCLTDALARNLRYDLIKECKFLSAIIPDEHSLLDVMIQVKQNEEEVTIQAEVLCGDAKMMKLKAILIQS